MPSSCKGHGDNEGSLRKLCIICISLRAGGTERVVSRTANYLSKSHDVSLILLSQAPVFYELNPNISLIQPDFTSRGKLGWQWYFRIFLHLWRAVSGIRPNLVLCFGEMIAPLVLVVSRASRVPTLVFNRASPLSSLRGLRGLLNPLTYPLANKVVVQTMSAVRLMRKRYRLSDFRVLPNPVLAPTLITPIDERRLRILNVGSLGGKKNQVRVD